MMNATATALKATDPIDAPTVGAQSEPRPFKRLVHFRNGLFGFPEHRQFTLRATDHEGLYWLQSNEDEALAFLLADPFVFVRDYVVELHDAEVAELGTTAASDLPGRASGPLPRPPDRPGTPNLPGAVAERMRTGRAKQVILTDTEFGLRHPVDLSRRADA